MIIQIPTEWPQMSAEAFSQFLTQCPDYRTDAFANARRYYYAWNWQDFAYVTRKGKIWVHPEIAPVNQ